MENKFPTGENKFPTGATAEELKCSVKTEQRNGEKPKKKPYSKPVLRHYGDIRTMTSTSVGRHERSDHGHGRFHKTA